MLKIVVFPQPRRPINPTFIALSPESYKETIKFWQELRMEGTLGGAQREFQARSLGALRSRPAC